MLTHLRFKNWRSLKDVEINDLTPITVFIGANSSGKTNIVDALKFRRFSATQGLVEAVSKWQGRAKIRTIGVGEGIPVEISYSYVPHSDSQPITDSLKLTFSGRDIPFMFSSTLTEGTSVIDERGFELPLPSGFIGEAKVFSKGPMYDYYKSLSAYTEKFNTDRWQILSEFFVSPTTLSRNDDPGNLLQVEADAKNILFILDIMRGAYPELYSQLQSDLKWLLGYVNTMDVVRDERDIHMHIREMYHVEEIAPSVSSGTARLVAILTAFYVLDMDFRRLEYVPSVDEVPEIFKHPYAEMPGLVVIEEPDSALNPLLLKRFMELIRSYVDGEHPRQVIMTTHNPHFLDLFQPEEVRIVERDDQGYTTVKQVPDYIKDIWLDEYGLGEVWTTRSFGGVPK